MFKNGDNERGFTLVELLVVIAILSILASLSVAGFARLGAGARQELQRTTRHLQNLLGAARVYADTFRVRTAVVYSLDNYDPPTPPGDPPDLTDNAIARPITDTITGQHMRVITAVAVLYELPRTSGHFSGVFVPVPDDAGNFTTFEGEQVLMLNDPRPPAPNNLRPPNVPPWPYLEYYYQSDRARYENAAPINAIDKLGMRPVDVFVDTAKGPSGPFAPEGSPLWLQPLKDRLPAHVFTPGGRLETTGGLERYTLFVAPPPNANENELLVNPADRTSERIYRPLYLYRSTGRVKGSS